MTASICSNGETHTVCDVCSRCQECDRVLAATPHVFVCACPEPHDIDLCGDCRIKETAFQLTRQRSDPAHFWLAAAGGTEPEADE